MASLHDSESAQLEFPKTQGGPQVHNPLKNSPRRVTLPFEILSSIFLMMLSSWDEEYSTYTARYRRMEAYDFIRASQVCQYWRSVALNLPELWGMIINVDFNKSIWIRELIHRSSDAPLIVESIHSLDRSHEGVLGQKWALLYAQMHRIRILHITCPSNFLFNSTSPLMNALSHPAPLMESFKISPDCGFHSAVLDRLPVLFSASTHGLRELIIDRMELLSFVRFDKIKLIHLDITQQGYERGIPTQSWLDVLDSQPLLQHLSLSAVVFDPTVEKNISPQRQVHLPHLRHLYISSGPDHCDRIFPRLVLPTSCMLGLSTNTPQIRSYINKDVLHGLQTYFQGWDQELPCKVWNIHVKQWLDISVTAFEVEDAESYPVASIDLYARSPEGVGVPTVLLFDLLRDTGVLKEATTLKFLFHTMLSPEAQSSLQRLLVSCPKVSTLTVLGPCTTDWLFKPVLMDDRIPSISRDSHAETDNPTDGSLLSTHILPELTTVVYHEGPGEVPRDVSNELLDFIHWRSRTGKKIQKFTMSVHDPSDWEILPKTQCGSLMDLELELTAFERPPNGSWTRIIRTPPIIL